MRTRDEVLIDRFLQNDTFTLEQGEDLRDAVKRMADRIRELEAQLAASEPVAITDAMVEAAARAFYGAFYDGDRLWVRCPDDIRVWWMDAGRDALTAALTVASEGASA